MWTLIPKYTLSSDMLRCLLFPRGVCSCCAAGVNCWFAGYTSNKFQAYNLGIWGPWSVEFSIITRRNAASCEQWTPGSSLLIDTSNTIWSSWCCDWSQLFRWVVFLVPHGFPVSPLSSWEYLWVLKPGFWNIGVSAMSGETRNVMILVLTGSVAWGGTPSRPSHTS